MNKVAVTGASGFIGAYLCRALVSQNFFVNGIDNNLRGEAERLSGISNNFNINQINPIIYNNDSDSLINNSCINVVKKLF